MLAGHKPGGGTLFIQSGGAAAANHNERMQGIRDTLAGRRSESAPGERLEGAGGWTEVDGCPLFSNDDFALAVSQMQDVLALHQQLDAFVVTGGFPQFVPRAYRQTVERHAGRVHSGALRIVVADTLPMQMALLRDGLSHAQIGQRPFEMGYRSIFVLHELAAGRAVADPIYTGIDLCLPETADTCVGG